MVVKMKNLMTGYKATDKDMKCRGFQFELGKWFEHEGELVECQSGFHFCEQPSGPWAYYQDPGTRVFKVECEGVLEKPFAPGADAKRVCKRIRFVEEINATGNCNTGNRNTGNRNTGDWNTGNWNTGDSNTGDRNTGDSNTGYRNTGTRNTGNRNTGNWNTGNWNTGDSNTGTRNTGDSNTGNRNTGNSNTGDRNTGNWNTGDSNTGNWNATDRSNGFFCIHEPNVCSFDFQTELTYEQFLESFPESFDLGSELHQPFEIDFAKYARIPGITPEKLKELHRKHLAAKESKEQVK